MSKPKNLHDIPDPHFTVAGSNLPNTTGSKLSLENQAKKFRPPGVLNEPDVATLARFANYLIDRETGEAYSAEELASVSSILSKLQGFAADPERIGIEYLPAGVQEVVSATVSGTLTSDGATPLVVKPLYATSISNGFDSFTNGNQILDHINNYWRLIDEYNDAEFRVTSSAASPNGLVLEAVAPATGNATVTCYSSVHMSIAGVKAALANSGIPNPLVSAYRESKVDLGTVGASATIAISSGTVITATLTASTATTFTMPAQPAAGQSTSFTLLLKQAASTGNGTASFTGVKWGSSGAPTITATAGKMDILTFTSDGTNWYGSIGQGFTP